MTFYIFRLLSPDGQLYWVLQRGTFLAQRWGLAPLRAAAHRLTRRFACVLAQMDAHLTDAEKVAAAVQAYYRQADTLHPTPHELSMWLAQLSATQLAEITLLPVAQRHTLPVFRRFLLESRGYSMARYMANHLSLRELRLWVDDGDGGVRAL